MRLPSALLLAFLLHVTAAAQTPGACPVGAALGSLNITDVNAALFNNGSLFYSDTYYLGFGRYVVPQSRGLSPLYAAGLWVGGFVNGDVRTAGSNFTRFSFAPGPIGATGSPPADCEALDRIYMVSDLDLIRYETTGFASADLSAWPVGLGAPTTDATGQPVVSSDPSRVVNLAAGERPVVYGVQTAFWVMNDLADTRTLPLGIEVRVTAFSALGTPELRQSTFYRYQIINKSGTTIESARAGFFWDPDLGGPGDDHMATDTTRSMFVTLNAYELDEVYGTPPALGIDLLNGAASSAHIFNYSQVFEDSRVPEEMYNRMQGLFNDGTPMRERGDGYGAQGGAPVTTFSFSGDPVLGVPWSMVNPGPGSPVYPGGDMRGVISGPSETLAPGETMTFDVAILFAQGTDRLDSVVRLRAASDAIQTLHDAGNLFSATVGADIQLLDTPQLLLPDDDAVIASVDSVRFDWSDVPGATEYVLTISRPGDPFVARREFTTTSNAAVAYADLPLDPIGLQNLQWNVSILGPTAASFPSEVRSLGLFRHGILRLSNGDPAYVEVANADNTEVCGAAAASTEMCDELDNAANPVYRSMNSTNDWYFNQRSGGAEYPLVAFAPNDFEIRFTDAGGLAAFSRQIPYNVVRVPFEVWDVGPVGTGANDPSDDVRLIPFLWADNGGTCAFDPAEIPDSNSILDGFVESDRIDAYYAATDYAAFETTFADAVANAPDNCFQSNDAFLLYGFTSIRQPIVWQVFGSDATAPVLPRTGTVVRMLTTAPFSVAATPSAPKGDATMAIRTYPNPARGATTVTLTLTQPGDLRLRVTDMLGRRVLDIDAGSRAAGAQEIPVQTASLAAGLYVVSVEAGEMRASRLISVVR